MLTRQAADGLWNSPPLTGSLAYQRLDMSHRLTYDMAYGQKWR